MRIDKADSTFSQYIRKRDKRCMRCGSDVEFNGEGMPISHQNSHYYGRRMESVRYDPENCDTLCHGCHRYWEKEDREAYREFKVKQLGQRGFDLLMLRAHLYHKKDRKMELIKAKLLLESL